MPSAPGPAALGLRAYVSGKSPMAMLQQLVHKPVKAFEVWPQWNIL